MQETKPITQTPGNKSIRGIVKWFNAAKGYGFITNEDSKDFFMHYSQIQMNGFRHLDKGDIVSFNTEETRKGIQAVNIVPLLTLQKVCRELRKSHCTLSTVKDSYGNTLWLVVDENNFIQSPETGMSLEEVADFIGLEWNTDGEEVGEKCA